MKTMERAKHHFSIYLLFLWISVLIFSAGNSIIAKLGELGAHHLVEGRNPISFCNVLFTANIIAGFTLLGIHHKTWNKKNLLALKGQHWMHMLILAILSVSLLLLYFF